MTRFANLTDAAKALLGTEITDYGAPINFRNPHADVKSMSGPMRRAQLREYFRSREELPSVAIYLDLDFYKEPKEEMNAKSIVGLVKQYAEDAWDINEELRNLILG
jgi:hypothetical protein